MQGESRRRYYARPGTDPLLTETAVVDGLSRHRGGCRGFHQTTRRQLDLPSQPPRE